MSHPISNTSEDRVLILAPVGCDGSLAVNVLVNDSIQAVAVDCLVDLIAELSRGAAALIIASEALEENAIGALAESLGSQPAWSELPVILLTPSMPSINPLFDVASALGPPGNVIFLERPLTYEGLIGTVRLALRSRRRQYHSRDILQQLDRANTDLMRSNQDLERFAYIAAHDLQEPLRMISGHLGVIQKRCLSQLEDRAVAHFRIAIDGAERMRDMLEALLAYSRVGRQHDIASPCNTAQAVRLAVGHLANQITRVQATIEVPSDLPIVHAQCALLSQVFQNLVGNALKFTVPGRLPIVRIAATWDQGYWTFSVSDNGIGIAPEDQGRIFDLFQRLHTVGQYPGSGIGLSTCRRIVDLHGGRIWVDSTPGSGSTFRFTLPAVEDPSFLPSRSQPSARDSASSAASPSERVRNTPPTAWA
jgi:signal transduction histidine kinase